MNNNVTPEQTPSFDELRYLTPWHDLIQRYGIETALKWLIIWQVLNNWNIDQYPHVLVLVFGMTIETVVPDLIQNPPKLQEQFTIIEGEDFPERLKTYCERILKQHDSWLLYDP